MNIKPNTNTLAAKLNPNCIEQTNNLKRNVIAIHRISATCLITTKSRIKLLECNTTLCSHVSTVSSDTTHKWRGYATYIRSYWNAVRLRPEKQCTLCDRMDTQSLDYTHEDPTVRCSVLIEHPKRSVVIFKQIRFPIISRVPNFQIKSRIKLKVSLANETTNSVGSTSNLRLNNSNLSDIFDTSQLHVVDMSTPRSRRRNNRRVNQDAPRNILDIAAEDIYDDAIEGEDGAVFEPLPLIDPGNVEEEPPAILLNQAENDEIEEDFLGQADMEVEPGHVQGQQEEPEQQQAQNQAAAAAPQPRDRPHMIMRICHMNHPATILTANEMQSIIDQVNIIPIPILTFLVEYLPFTLTHLSCVSYLHITYLLFIFLSCFTYLPFIHVRSTYLFFFILKQIEDLYDAVEDNVAVNFLFTRPNPTQGFIEIGATNDESVGWLERNLPQVRSTEPLLAQRIVPDGPRSRFSLRIRNRMMSERRFFNRLQQLNPGLTTTSWRIVSQRPLPGGLDCLLIISCDEAGGRQIEDQFMCRVRIGIQGTSELRRLTGRAENGGDTAERFVGFRRTNEQN